MASKAASMIPTIERRPTLLPRQTWWVLGTVLTVALVLPWTVSIRSVTADEAFSAYVACQRGWGSFWAALRTGDSSDLQMIGYYAYLHVWTIVFGVSEYALRASNLPFIACFVATVASTAWRVSRSLWPCLLACSLPLVWEQANNTRPYIAVIAFASVAVAAASASLSIAQRSNSISHPSLPGQRSLPWIVLGTLWLACAFHMLAGLCVLPLTVFLVLGGKSTLAAARNVWIRASATMALPFLALGAFFAWTFWRGTDYRYESPSPWSIASLLYRFLGLGTFGPNRRYDVPFNGHLIAMALAALVLAAAIILLTALAWQTSARPFAVAFGTALTVAFAEVVVVIVIMGRQLDTRHVAALLPFWIGFLLTLTSPPVLAMRRAVSVCAALACVAVYSVADYRLLFVPEHQTEDFRSAIRQCIAFQQTQNADILLAADPVAAAYYGLRAEGEKPCFPLAEDCRTALDRVSWTHTGRASYALSWTAPRIRSLIADHRARRLPLVVLFNEQRDALYSGSAWSSVLLGYKNHIVSSPQGFSVYLFQ